MDYGTEAHHGLRHESPTFLPQNVCHCALQPSSPSWSSLAIPAVPAEIPARSRRRVCPGQYIQRCKGARAREMASPDHEPFRRAAQAPPEAVHASAALAGRSRRAGALAAHLATPVPVSGTAWGESTASSVNARVAERVPSADGRKTSTTWHDAPGTRAWFWHVSEVIV
jgi:hypothetical protein